MIVVPYTDLNAKTKAALPGAQFIRLSEPDAYRLLLRRLWAIGETFTLVEHDVIPRPGQLDALDRCSKPWCGYGYGPGDWTPTFGCVRFSSELIAAIPYAFDDETWPWNQLDARFAVLARASGFRHHWHFPHVHHERYARIGERDGQIEVGRGPLSLDEQIGVAEAELFSIRGLIERSLHA